MYGVDYAGLGACVGIQGLKEIEQIIENQQVRINELEARLVELETKTSKE